MISWFLQACIWHPSPSFTVRLLLIGRNKELQYVTEKTNKFYVSFLLYAECEQSAETAKLEVQSLFVFSTECKCEKVTADRVFFIVQTAC